MNNGPEDVKIDDTSRSVAGEFLSMEERKMGKGTNDLRIPCGVCKLSEETRRRMGGRILINLL